MRYKEKESAADAKNGDEILELFVFNLFGRIKTAIYIYFHLQVAAKESFNISSHIDLIIIV